MGVVQVKFLTSIIFLFDLEIIQIKSYDGGLWSGNQGKVNHMSMYWWASKKDRPLFIGLRKTKRSGPSCFPLLFNLTPTTLVIKAI